MGTYLLTHFQAQPILSLGFEEIAPPRDARKQCETGIYHVMLRGINQTQLFYDDEKEGLSIRQISRLTEINRDIIQRGSAVQWAADPL
jgi:hypothetical protein